jgi:hypothetical protein
MTEAVWIHCEMLGEEGYLSLGDKMFDPNGSIRYEWPGLKSQPAVHIDSLTFVRVQGSESWHNNGPS